MKEDILEMKRELEDMKEESFARELLKDYKKQNKRWFIVWIITFITLIGVTCYTIYLLNDIGYIDEDNDTIDIQDVQQIDNSTIKIGDDIWEKSQ